MLLFGTTCSPCCAIHALQYHVQEHKDSKAESVDIVEHSFYVDNYLHSIPTASDAKVIVSGLRQLLSEGGFDIRQWACNLPSVIEHLPSEPRSTGTER